MAFGWTELYAEWDVKKALIDGHWFLWIAIEDEKITAAVVTRFQDYPKRRVCEVLLASGGPLPDWLSQVVATIETHARQRGADFIQGFGRSGWGRAAGARETCRVFMKEI